MITMHKITTFDLGVLNANFFTYVKGWQIEVKDQIPANIFYLFVYLLCILWVKINFHIFNGIGEKQEQGKYLTANPIKFKLISHNAKWSHLFMFRLGQCFRYSVEVSSIDRDLGTTGVLLETLGIDFTSF